MDARVLRIVDLVIERAEQACRYALKHNEDNIEGEYALGFEAACDVCEKAIRDQVMRHIEADLRGLIDPVAEAAQARSK